LAGIVKEWSFKSFGDEVGVDAILIDTSRGEHFFEGITGCAWLDELLLWGLRLGLDD
jgi:hypothetical protein